MLLWLEAVLRSHNLPIFLSPACTRTVHAARQVPARCNTRETLDEGPIAVSRTTSTPCSPGLPCLWCRRIIYGSTPTRVSLCRSCIDGYRGRTTTAHPWLSWYCTVVMSTSWTCSIDYTSTIYYRIEQRRSTRSTMNA